MNGPWNKYQQPETVSEGGPWSKYGQMSPREAVDALPEFLTRARDEKAADQSRISSEQQAVYDELSEIPRGFYGPAWNDRAKERDIILESKGKTMTGPEAAAVRFGNSVGLTLPQHLSKETNDAVGAAGREYPGIAKTADVAGFMVPGSLAFKAVDKGLRGSGAMLFNQNLVPQGAGVMSRLGRYAPVVASGTGAGIADYALYEGTVGAGTRAAEGGRLPTLDERGDAAKAAPFQPEAYLGGVVSPLYRAGRGVATTFKNTVEASKDAGKLVPKAGSFTPTPRAEWAAKVMQPKTPQSEAYRMVAKRLKKDNITPEQLHKAIDNYYYAGYSSVDEMLFELAEAATNGKGGGQIKNLAVALGAVGGDAQQTAREAFRVRREMMPEKFQGSLQRAAGLTGKGETAKEFYDVLDDFAEKQVTAPKPLYEEAYANEVSDNLFVSKVLPELSTARESGVLAEAADYARGVARTSDELDVARRIGRELAELDDDLGRLDAGKISPSAVRKPSTQALDYIERMFADQGRGIRKGTGRAELARGPEGASARLRQGIDNTGLSDAREMSSRYKTAQEAMNFARTKVSNTTDLETLQREFAGHIKRLDPDAPPDSPTVRAALLMGYIRGADDIIMKASSPATAIRQLYGSKRQREKMVAMLTDLDEETKEILTSGQKGDATKRLRALVGGKREDGVYHPGEFDRARAQLNSENQIVGNSQTGQRNEAVAAQGGMERLLRQGYEIAKNPGKAVDDVVDLAINRVSKPGIFKPEVNRELGNIMFKGGRKDLQKIVSELEKMQKRPKVPGAAPSSVPAVGAVAANLPQKKAAQNSILPMMVPNDRTELASTGAGALVGGSVGLEDYNEDGNVDWRDALLTPEGRGGIVSGAGAGLLGAKGGKMAAGGAGAGRMDRGGRTRVTAKDIDRLKQAQFEAIYGQQRNTVPFDRLASKADFERSAERVWLPDSFQSASPEEADAILLQAIVDDLIDQGMNPKPILRELGHIKNPPVTNGIGGRRLKDVMKDASSNNLPAVKSDKMPPGGLPMKSQRPVDTGYGLPEASALKENLTKIGVVGAGLGIPGMPMLWSMYKSSQYGREGSGVSFQEFVAAVEEEQRRRNGLPPTPSAKPELPLAR